jgi:hypothetical protein
MFWLILFWLLPMVPPAAVPANAPLETPPEIVDAWLRFHETELCQSLDARFVFHPDGLEVWCVVEDEKAFEKFQALLEPLRPAFHIEVYPTRPPPARKSGEPREPLPSLWNNEELRNYLRTAPGLNLGTGDMQPNGDRDPDFFTKQRMIMFAEQTLDYERRMTRYGTDLPSLVYTGQAPGTTPQQKIRSTTIAAQHAAALDKYAARLIDNLQQALPKPPRKNQLRTEPAARQPGMNLTDSASQLARLAQAAGRRIYHFLNPQRHTVEVSDLKEPSLLESMHRVRSLTSEFRDSVKESVRR